MHGNPAALISPAERSRKQDTIALLHQGDKAIGNGDKLRIALQGSLHRKNPTENSASITFSFTPRPDIHLPEGDLNSLLTEALIDPGIDIVLDIPRIVIVVCPENELSVQARFTELKKYTDGDGSDTTHGVFSAASWAISRRIFFTRDISVPYATENGILTFILKSGCA